MVAAAQDHSATTNENRQTYENRKQQPTKKKPSKQEQQCSEAQHQQLLRPNWQWEKKYKEKLDDQQAAVLAASAPFMTGAILTRDYQHS